MEDAAPSAPDGDRLSMEQPQRLRRLRESKHRVGWHLGEDLDPNIHQYSLSRPSGIFCGHKTEETNRSNILNTVMLESLINIPSLPHLTHPTPPGAPAVAKIRPAKRRASQASPVRGLVT